MWLKSARIILRKRQYFLIGIALITIFMGYRASQTELWYETPRVLPSNDSTWMNYQQFRSLFGEDGSVLVIGIQDSDIFKLNHFTAWYNVEQKIKSDVEGIKNVLSITSLYQLTKADSAQKLSFRPLLTAKPQSQPELDSLKTIILSESFYKGLVFNTETHATLMAITFQKKNLNSSDRIDMVEKIKNITQQFENEQHVKVHFSGMPYVRTEYMKLVVKEMKLFQVLALLITSIILFLFFRSFSAVFFSMIIIIIEVIWSLGIMELLGYKISVLTGILPPLITVIGIPNCIFLINKYHAEYAKHGHKGLSLYRMVDRVGLSLLLANITTAIGFAVFYFTRSQMLMEFGVVAAINVMATFLLTLILIPAIFSYLPSPSTRRIKHLDAVRINKILQAVDYLVHHHRKAIYITIAAITAISIFGMTKIKVLGFVVDDLPAKHPIYSDLKFFEANFKGVLPFEVWIDAQKPNGIFANNGQNIIKMHALQKKLTKYPELSKPVSLVEGVKFAYQAYRGGDSKYYIFPAGNELVKLSKVLPDANTQNNKLTAFVDSTRQNTHLSYQMADVGSIRMKQLIKSIQHEADSIFASTGCKVHLTGHSLVFLKNNDYLLRNLLDSLLIEILLIALIGMILFRSVRIIVLSKLPCIIPLIITAGIMGFAGVVFKASTILIFTIAFGIASDGTIYFLTRYRHELRKNNLPVTDAISVTIRETGLSMIYTSMILFFGFAIFAASSFGGTIALGILVSTTLFVSMLTNLILLPSILLSIDKYVSHKELTEPGLLDITEQQEI